tara:strand:- start:396 stop:545 length:150 start_codon:yes stop_codon:yes gene_type:complete
MIYVLMMIVAGGGGFSAEFESQAACEAARSAFLEEAQKQISVSMCVPKA